MFKQFRHIKLGEQIVVGGDLSSGCGDYSVSQFYSKTNFDYPMVYSSLKTGSEMTNEVYPVLEKIADVTGYKPLVAWESNNGGNFEMDRLANMNRLGKYEIFLMPTIGVETERQTIKRGWNTNSATRPEMLSLIKNCIESFTDKIYDRQTIEEAYSFVVVRTASGWKAQAEKNAHDDHLMAMAVARIVANSIKDKDFLRIIPKDELEDEMFTEPQERKYRY